MGLGYTGFNFNIATAGNVQASNSFDSFGSFGVTNTATVQNDTEKADMWESLANIHSYELFDKRIYRAIRVTNSKTLPNTEDLGFTGMTIKPFISRQTYIGDFIPSRGAILQYYGDIMQTITDSAAMSANDKFDGIAVESNAAAKELDRIKADMTQSLEETANLVSQPELARSYASSFSMMHPYALLRLSGARVVESYLSGEKAITSGRMASIPNNIIDNAKYRRWYEIAANSDPNTDMNDAALPATPTIDHYSKNPTTGDIISWSAQDLRGRFPYAFQDFVFCKHWNKIPNNRMITLRRYPGPVLDNVEPANYAKYETLGDPGSDASNGSVNEAAVRAQSRKKHEYRPEAMKKNEPFSPLATAVTYFGTETENNLSELLSFTVGYEWEEMVSDIHNTTSQQIEEGQVFNDSGAGKYLNQGLGLVSLMLGIMGDFQGTSRIHPEHAVGLPPDPYVDGPYVNRVLGPVNCIQNVYKRKRGLKFSSDGLTLTFDYVSRPISNVNNKAILLDILANIMALTYASGIWFGGAHKYRQEHPAIYPWRNMSSLNKIYSGKLFGKDGAFAEIFRTFYNDKTLSFVGNLAKDLIEGVKAIAHDLVNAVTGNKSSGEQAEQDKAAKQKAAGIFNRGIDTAGRAMAAHMLKGQQAPWLQGAKALLTGDPIGDWHLTIGNPLNPIAMIGNLIVDNCTIEFYDELGPDDFPIGFKAKIKLLHGMGRDKDAVESMFNRGNGRLYILSDAFKSSADFETKVDNYTGGAAARMNVEQYGALQTSGSFSMTGKVSTMKIGRDAKPTFYDYDPTLIYSAVDDRNLTPAINIYKSTSWALHQIL